MALLLSTTMNNLRPKLFCHSSGSVNENPATMFRLFTGLNVKNNKREKFSIIGLAIKNPSGSQTTERIHGKITPRKGKGPVLSEGRDEDENYGPVCPGCGVFMQDKDPNFPGYYKKRRVITKEVLKDEDGGEEGFEGEIEGFSDEEGEEFWDGIEGKLEGSDSEGDDMEEGDEFDWDSDEWEAKFLKEEDESEFDGFAPAGVGYGNITEETIEKSKRKRLSKAERKRLAREAKKDKDEVTVCARCHSLRNYGQVKNQSSENLIPDFDFERLVATRFVKPTGNDGATVVVMVVDCVDFDGSFPKRAANSLFTLLEGAQNDPKLSKKVPKLVLVATKVDLLPSQISPTRLDRWVRHRAKAGGAPKLNGVYMVSAHKDLGVRNLEVKVSGTSWVVNSVDIAAAGLGWFSLGLKGEASLTLWTYDGIEITTREPLVLDRARFIERPGFWLSKAISDAIGNQTRSEAKKKKLQEESSETLVEVSA
ncbi:hypothetical protein SLEP1_g49127 [Rubroshorea leprosula]|uniref:Uncharacterized protein n=1 Tax=Rubroshorea leprosula TaxID=152421 RepID=A0AAV5LY91_9ROSI|nr:hypothetical protein SLEP1_g49127 [Rubroshorea leprosula]